VGRSEPRAQLLAERTTDRSGRKSETSDPVPNGSGLHPLAIEYTALSAPFCANAVRSRSLNPRRDATSRNRLRCLRETSLRCRLPSCAGANSCSGKPGLIQFPLSQSTSRHAETARTQARPEVAQIRGASNPAAVLRSTQFSRQPPASDTT
jgi:hypothetical protein